MIDRQGTKPIRLKSEIKRGGSEAAPDDRHTANCCQVREMRKNKQVRQRRSWEVYWLNLSPQQGKIFISTEAGCHLLSERAGEKAPCEQCLCVAQRKLHKEHAKQPSPPWPEHSGLELYFASPHDSPCAHLVTQFLNLTVGLLKHSSFV